MPTLPSIAWATLVFWVKGCREIFNTNANGADQTHPKPKPTPNPTRVGFHRVPKTHPRPDCEQLIGAGRGRSLVKLNPLQSLTSTSKWKVQPYAFILMKFKYLKAAAFSQNLKIVPFQMLQCIKMSKCHKIAPCQMLKNSPSWKKKKWKTTPILRGKKNVWSSSHNIVDSPSTIKFLE